MLISPSAALSARIRLMRDSYAFASPGLGTRACRHAVTLLFAAGEAPAAVCWRHGTERAPALMVAPRVDRRLDMAATPFVLVDVEPRHASYRRFARAACGAVQPVPADRAELQNLHALCRAFHAGALRGTDVDRALRPALQALAETWPDPGPLDPRVDWMMSSMDRAPSVTLEQLARRLGLSPTRASRLFSSQMGIPARAYATAAKVHAAARCMGSGCSLTEVALAAGFADSAHFAKVWLRCYGAPPSAYFQPRRVALDAEGLSGWARWRPPPAVPVGGVRGPA